MTKITVASYNIEKSGQSSTLDKQTKVGGFVDNCVHYNGGVDIIFLCEVHSARINDYLIGLRAAYSAKYAIGALPGGNSNAYVFMYKHTLGAIQSYYQFKGLNRNLLFLQVQDAMLVLGHFKSGETGLTRSQIEEAAGFLQGATDQHKRWAITGDMNWDYHSKQNLHWPGPVSFATCWADMTQKSGHILDWCVAGKGLKIDAVDGHHFFPHELHTMDGPDHRPVLFALSVQ